MLNEFRKQRNDKNKKRKDYIKRNLSYESRRTGRNLIRTIKDNPVESIAIGAGGLLATRYGSKGLINAIKTKVPLNSNLTKSSVIKSKSFLQGMGQGVKKDLTRLDKVKQYFNRGK